MTPIRNVQPTRRTHHKHTHSKNHQTVSIFFKIMVLWDLKFLLFLEYCHRLQMVSECFNSFNSSIWPHEWPRELMDVILNCNKGTMYRRVIVLLLNLTLSNLNVYVSFIVDNVAHRNTCSFRPSQQMVSPDVKWVFSGRHSCCQHVLFISFRHVTGDLQWSCWSEKVRTNNPWSLIINQTLRLILDSKRDFWVKNTVTLLVSHIFQSILLHSAIPN